MLIALGKLLLLLLVVGTASGVHAASGGACAGCTIAVGLLEQLVVIHNTTVDDMMDKICGYFPKEFVPTCDYFVNTYGEKVIALLEAKETPDTVCNQIEMCSNPSCMLFPAKQPIMSHDSIKMSVHAWPQQRGKQVSSTDTPWQWIKDLVNRMANDHEPVEDADDDDFSVISELRGWSWKGRDCNDLDKSVHAGVHASQSDPAVDWNCNGISGTDPQSHADYEEMLCGNSTQFGLIVVGDSFGAHFSIPPSYMNASEINSTTYSDLLYVLENEFDWPERSAFSGFEENTTLLPINSLYQRLRERNLCNHRDYQNVGVNGARSGAIEGILKQGVARNQTDVPVLLVFELIGNDVCSPHPELSSMTTPEEFRTNVLNALNYLDTVLPEGSHIMFIGLADGRALWDNLHNRTHPIGVSYESVYNYLNCLQISPCWVWMNENSSIRDAGSQRAAELSAVYNEIIANTTFRHFDMAYYDFPFPEISAMWEEMGGETWQLIEPVDGFHPNQIAHTLIASYLWSQLTQDHPTFVGAVNPNNAAIARLFGDQGGY